MPDLFKVIHIINLLPHRRPIYKSYIELKILKLNDYIKTQYSLQGKGSLQGATQKTFHNYNEKVETTHYQETRSSAKTSVVLTRVKSIRYGKTSFEYMVSTKRSYMLKQTCS